MPVSFILSGSGDKGRDQGTALPSLSLALCHFRFSESCGAGGGYPDAPWLPVAPLPAEPSEPGGVRRNQGKQRGWGASDPSPGGGCT